MTNRDNIVETGQCVFAVIVIVSIALCVACCMTAILGVWVIVEDKIITNFYEMSYWDIIWPNLVYGGMFSAPILLVILVVFIIGIINKK